MIKKFIELESKEYREFYAFYTALSPSLSPEEKKASLMTWLSETYLFPEASLLFLADHLIGTLSDSLDVDSEEDPTSIPQLFLTQSDITYLTDFIIKDPDSPPPLLYLLTSYLTYAREYPHPNHWIKCDSHDKTIITYLASCSSLPPKQLEQYLNILHTSCSLNMRVIGSKQPIPCYQFTFQQDPDASSNPLISIGPQDPLTIKSFVDHLITSFHSKEC